MARPQVEIDMDKLAALMRFRPTLADCAAFFKCSEDTIERRIKESTDLSFAQFREQQMVHTRTKLIQTALTRAEKSDTMLIFALKNFCNWTDKQTIETNQPGATVNNVVSVSDDQLKTLIKAARGNKE